MNTPAAVSDSTPSSLADASRAPTPSMLDAMLDAPVDLPADVTAGLLSLYDDLAAEYGFPLTPSAAFEELGVSPARIAEARAAILELPTLVKPPRDRRPELAVQVIRYLKDHTGAAHVIPGVRSYYSKPYRRFLLELRERYSEIEHEEFARCVCVPPETLSRWVRKARRS